MILRFWDNVVHRVHGAWQRHAPDHRSGLDSDLTVDSRLIVAEGRAASVSAYVTEALTRRCADDELLGMLAEMKAEHGEPTGDDYAWAEQALGLR